MVKFNPRKLIIEKSFEDKLKSIYTIQDSSKKEIKSESKIIKSDEIINNCDNSKTIIKNNDKTIEKNINSNFKNNDSIQSFYNFLLDQHMKEYLELKEFKKQIENIQWSVHKNVKYIPI
jgi:hypothetical protein